MMMKKVFVLIMCVTAGGTTLFAQSGGAGVRLLDVGNYSKLFLNGAGSLSRKYYRESSDEDYNRIAALGGEYLDAVDTPLEIALLSTCAGVVDVRPVEAVKMLGTAREADLKLGAAAYMEMQAAKFLGSDPAPCAAALKFITDRGRVTEADIKSFVKQGIAAAVDAEFNRVSFFIENIIGQKANSYNGVLTRNPQNQYILSYERPSVENDDKQITAPSLSALLTEMKSGANRADFNQNCIDQVNAEYANIPAVFLERIGKDPRAALADIITAFYLNPTNQTVYGAVRDVNVFYTVARHISKNPTEATLCRITQNAYINAIAVLSLELARRVEADSQGRTSVTLSVEVRNRLQPK
jgi:hypothetical protein